MTRVLLVHPPAPARLGAPLLGQQYVAAALLARGCEVRVLDCAACRVAGDAASVVAAIERFAPHVVGVGLVTRWVWHAYRLAEVLRGRARLLVAGGPHATVRPAEALAHGFDVAVQGEAEETIVRLVDHVEGRARLEEIPGIRWRDAGGTIRRGPARRFIADLDALPLPQLAQDLYDPRWYAPPGTDAIPAGILTSRGCPSHCTFCANHVTGRTFRYRSAQSVVTELKTYHRRTGATFVAFWDDALTADSGRLLALCAALERDLDFALAWSAATRASMVTPELLRAMRRAGLVAVNFGVESGDDGILRAIGKGVSTDQVVRALEWAKAEGLRTAANFMLGFPQESPAALERTRRFMERIAPLCDVFSTLGVVVPFPGTRLYDAFHARYGFTDWWLREDHSRYDAPPPMDDFDRFYRHYVDDATLGLDFFRYSPEMRALIRDCLRFKAEHNLRMMGVPGSRLPVDNQ